MNSFPSRVGIGLACLFALLAPARGQDDNRRFFKKPDTTAEYWRAIQYEINIGKYDLAGDFIKGLAAKKPSDDDLLQLEEKYGISSFLRLLAVPKWVDNPKENAEIKKEAEQLNERIGEIVRKHLADPERIDKFIKNLSASPEERAYAISQLRRSGAAAVPRLVEALVQSSDDPVVHTQILSTLPQLSRESVPPLLAALDISDPVIKFELLDALQKRNDQSVVPALWYLAGSPKEAKAVREKATAILSRLLQIEPDRLPAAKLALVGEADRYFLHKERFLNPEAVTIWLWEGKQLTSKTVSASKAEEYFGLRYARQALDIDPTYQPAQVIFLALALEKGYERAGVSQPLSKGAPDVKQLLSTINPGILTAVLEKGLKERRLPVVLGAVQALGELREGGPVGREESALIQALYFPDRRVQFAAAETILQLPGVTTSGDRAGTPANEPPVSSAVLPAMPAKARVVEILRRTAAADSTPRALVAYRDEDQANAVAAAVKQAGFEPVVVRTGREALRRLGQAADIDVILLDAGLPDPMLPNLLAQLRQDVNVGLLPVLLTATPAEINQLQSQVKGYSNVSVIPATADAGTLKQLLAEKINEAMGQPLSVAERKQLAEGAIQWLKRLAVGEVQGYDVRPAAGAVVAGLRSNDLAGAGAIETAGRLPGIEPQIGLATLVLTSDRPAPLRAAAAVELVRHLRQRGNLLTNDQMIALRNLLAAEKDESVKAKVALVVGNLRPSASQSGELIRGFSPPLETPAQAPAPAPAPAPMKEDK